MAGGLLGVALAWATLDGIVAVIPLKLPANALPTIDLPVLACAAVLSGLTAALTGIVPALRLSHAAIGSSLAVAGRTVGSPLTRRGGQVLIGVEVAIALVLLAAAGLMVRSFSRLTATPLGYDPAEIVVVQVQPVDPADQVMTAFYPAAVHALRAEPDVAAAGAVDDLALLGGGLYTGGRTDDGHVLQGLVRQVVPGYFTALGVRATQGRLPDAVDAASAEVPMVLDEAAVARFFDGRSPVGRVVTMRGTRGITCRIVGVVPTLRLEGPVSHPRPQMYVPFGHLQPEVLALIVRPRAGVTLSIDRIRALLGAVGPRVVVEDVRTGPELISTNVVAPRHRTVLLGLLGGLGIVLALVGIFSMTAYAVANRTREIGVRMAFGARPADVVARMVVDAAWPIAIGIGAGLVGAYFSMRLVASFLFQTTPHDPDTFLWVTIVVVATASLAAWLPARRAARVDPARALRTE